MPTRDDRSAAQNARQAILDSLNRFWKPAELDTAPSTAQHLLAELVNQGELRHLRRGLYWRGLKTPLGMAPPQPDVQAAELAGMFKENFKQYVGPGVPDYSSFGPK